MGSEKANVTVEIKKKAPKKIKKVQNSISTKLLRILVPMVAVAIVFIIIFLSFRARNIISNTAKESLLNDSDQNAAIIGAELTNLLAGYNQNIESIEKLGMTDPAEIEKYLEITLTGMR